MTELSQFVEAGKSVIDTVIDLRFKGNVKTMFVSAVDYMKRAQDGRGLSKEKRKIVNDVLLLGIAINNYYDMGVFNSNEYKGLRRKIKTELMEREEDYLRYRRELSNLEKHRPNPSEPIFSAEDRSAKIIKYREDVNKLSLAFAFSIAFDRPLSDYYENFGIQSQESQRGFNGFFNATMALQIVDDLIGMKGDLRHNRPSFYTAVCSKREIDEKKPRNDMVTFDKLEKLFSMYTEKMNSNMLDNMQPIVVAVHAIKVVYPRLTEFIRNHRSLQKLGGLHLLTWRDRVDL